MPISKARLRISDYNDNRKSRLKNQERRVRIISLSLTSMVDMFAILVIFLLANMDTYTEWVQLGHGIVLPKASSTEIPAQAATLQVSGEALFSDKAEIMKLSQVVHSPGPLRAWLSQQEKKDGYINVVAHNKIAFGIMKSIILACQEAGFKNVNLAVQP